MTDEEHVFLIDANVLIAAHRSYYAFDICPGFWEAVKSGHAAGRIFSIQHIKAELEKGKDALTDWINKELPQEFFINDSSAAIAKEFGPMMEWVKAGNFHPSAMAKFATDADGWLVAAAKQTGHYLVTHETRKPEAKASVPMPNLCDEFGVRYCNSFDMLRFLGRSFA